MALNLEEKIVNLTFVLDNKLMEMIWNNYDEDTMRTTLAYLKALYDSDEEMGDVYIRRLNMIRRIFPEEYETMGDFF